MAGPFGVRLILPKKGIQYTVKAAVLVGQKAEDCASRHGLR